MKYSLCCLACFLNDGFDVFDVVSTFGYLANVCRFIRCIVLEICTVLSMSRSLRKELYASWPLCRNCNRSLLMDSGNTSLVNI